MRLSIVSLLVLFGAISPMLASGPVEITTPELRGSVQPQVAVAPSGRIHVVFGKENAIYHTTSNDGVSFSKPARIGELDRLALKMRRGPRVTATDKVVLVTAISHTEGNLHAWTSTDDGKTFRETRAVNTVTKSAQEGLHALAGDGKGKVAVVWNDNRSKAMEVWGRFSTDGGVTWGEERKVYSAPNGPICPCCHPSVAFAPSGEIAVMWRNALDGNRDMFISTSGDFGKTFTPAQKLGDGTWKLSGCPMDGGSVVAGPDGKWITAWRREGKLFTNPIGAPEQGFADGKQPVIAFAGGKQITLWEQNGALMIRDASGKPAVFAQSGASPSVASGPKAATIAWEAGPAGTAGLFLQQVPAN